METSTEEINAIWCDGLLESSQDSSMNDMGESKTEASDRKIRDLSAKHEDNVCDKKASTSYSRDETLHR